MPRGEDRVSQRATPRALAPWDQAAHASGKRTAGRVTEGERKRQRRLDQGHSTSGPLSRSTVLLLETDDAIVRARRDRGLPSTQQHPPPRPSQTVSASIDTALPTLAPEEHTGAFVTLPNGRLQLHDAMPFLRGRYRVIARIGRGAYSQLVKVQDNNPPRARSPRKGPAGVRRPGSGGTDPNTSLFAVKIMHRGFAYAGVQEADALRQLNQADPFNQVPMMRVLETFTAGEHYCIRFPLLDVSLYGYIERLAGLNLPLCSVEGIQKIAVQLLSTLAFLRSQEYVHADLKPENILLTQQPVNRASDPSHQYDVSLKVIDFGNACKQEALEIYFQEFNAQTFPYRAPEVVLGMPFSFPIDMWSVGCILVELLSRKPLFGGRDKRELLHSMVKYLGPLPEQVFRDGKYFPDLVDPKFFTTDERRRMQSAKELARVLGCDDPVFLDFIYGLLDYNPSRRLTPVQALCHPFLGGLFPFTSLVASVKPIEVKKLQERVSTLAPSQKHDRILLSGPEYEKVMSHRPAPAHLRTQDHSSDEDDDDSVKDSDQSSIRSGEIPDTEAPSSHRSKGKRRSITSGKKSGSSGGSEKKQERTAKRTRVKTELGKWHSKKGYQHTSKALESSVKRPVATRRERIIAVLDINGPKPAKGPAAAPTSTRRHAPRQFPPGLVRSDILTSVTAAVDVKDEPSQHAPSSSHTRPSKSRSKTATPTASKASSVAIRSSPRPSSKPASTDTPNSRSRRNAPIAAPWLVSDSEYDIDTVLKAKGKKKAQPPDSNDKPAKVTTRKKNRSASKVARKKDTISGATEDDQSSATNSTQLAMSATSRKDSTRKVARKPSRSRVEEEETPGQDHADQSEGVSPQRSKRPRKQAAPKRRTGPSVLREVAAKGFISSDSMSSSHGEDTHAPKLPASDLDRATLEVSSKSNVVPTTNSIARGAEAKADSHSSISATPGGDGNEEEAMREVLSPLHPSGTGPVVASRGPQRLGGEARLARVLEQRVQGNQTTVESKSTKEQAFIDAFIAEESDSDLENQFLASRGVVIEPPDKESVPKARPPPPKSADPVWDMGDDDDVVMF